MAKTHRKKIGFVTLTQRPDGRWLARFTDPVRNKDAKRVLRVTSEEEASKACLQINRQILQERKELPGPKAQASDDLTVADAFAESIRATRGNLETKARYVRDANLFEDWVRENYPSVGIWDEIRPSMLIRWRQSMQEKGYAFDTIRQALVPIKRACSYWASEKPEFYRDYAKAAGNSLLLEKPPREESGEGDVLNIYQLRSFLEWLRAQAPGIHGMACLSGMAGLRIREAAYLRHCDIDWKKQTLVVTKSDFHTPKNRSSFRVVPMFSKALVAVHDFLESSKVQGVGSSPIFLHSRRKPWSHSGLNTIWQRTMQEARKDNGLDGMERFQPHYLRASFVTILREAKVDPRVLQAYIGHSPGDVLGEHYERIGIDLFRREIVNTFERVWAGEEEKARKDSGISASSSDAT